EQRLLSLLRDRRRHGAEIAGDDEHRAIAHSPARHDGGRPYGARIERRRAFEAGDDLGCSQRQQGPIKRLACAAGSRMRGGLGSFESFDGVGVGNLRQIFGIGKSGKAGKFATPAFPYSLGEIGIVVGEEQERRGTRRFLAHEYERNLRTQQLQRNRGLERRRFGKCREALAKGAVADLIVVLQKQDERRRRQIGAWRTAPFAAAIRRWLALIDETFLETTRQS